VLILPLAEAQPGMVLAAPVWHPAQPEQELLKRGYVLEKTVLQRLADLGVESIFVDFPGLDDLDRHLAAQLSPARMTIYNQIRETITANQRRTAPAVSFVDYYRSTRELVLTLVSQGQHPIFLDQMSRLPGDAVGHATAVAHLSMVLGLKLERYLIEQRHRLPPNHAREVVNLGVAGIWASFGSPQTCRRDTSAMSRSRTTNSRNGRRTPGWATN
jgi:hypothetical protein